MLIDRFALPGSSRSALKEPRLVGRPHPDDLVEVTVILRRRTPDAADAPSALGSHEDDAQAVEAFARQFDLTIVSVDLARRTVAVSGPIVAMSEAFGTRLALRQHESGVFRYRTGELFLPIQLQQIVTGVFGLDNRPQAVSYCRRRPHGALSSLSSLSSSYTPVDVAKAYGFPTATGSGETIAIIELGGGYRVSDLRSYFADLGVPMPAVTAVSVSGGRNAPTGDPNSADGEVQLDIEVVGAIAPGARLVVYFAPNTDKGFLDALSTAVHDPIRKPSIVSISWGAPESAWTKQAMRAYDEVFQDAAALGVSVCAAAGDNGSADGDEDGGAHVDFPASSPHVLSCGGTRLEAPRGRIAREVVWNDGRDGGATGGGVSEVFGRPSYQREAQVPSSATRSHFAGRGVPDVSGNADPATGYRIRIDGHETVVGGTSAVAPLWAALIALRNEMLGTRLGHANPVLYERFAGTGFRDITEGNNGAYRAARGWDPCTGLGSPSGGDLCKT